MSNPFPSQFDSHCQSCGDRTEEGDMIYAIDGEFVCRDCAEVKTMCVINVIIIKKKNIILVMNVLNRINKHVQHTPNLNRRRESHSR